MTTNTNEKVWTTKDLIYILMLFLGFGKNFYTDQIDAKEFKEAQEQIIDVHNDLQDFKTETATSIIKLIAEINNTDNDK